VTRLVIVSACPIADDRPRLPIWILRRVLATPYADAAQMEQIISASGLAWTIARLGRLTSKPATGAITTSTSLLPRRRAHTRAATDLAENPAWPAHRSTSPAPNASRSRSGDRRDMLENM
jgi:NAD(P)H-binding